MMALMEENSIMEAIEKANILVEALPYIKNFRGKTFVIKYGGNAMVNEKLKQMVMKDIVLLKLVGINPVVVHGGGPEINDMLKKLNKKPQFVNGLRVTDRETMEVVEMVLTGKVNKEIVSFINSYGGKAIGLSGKDGGLITAEKDLTNGDIGFVGYVKAVNTEIIDLLVKQGYIPVIAPVAIGEDGETYNINADTVAGEIAGSLGAEKLIMLTDVEGIYKNYADKNSLISSLDIETALRYIDDRIIDGGMIPKVLCCINAIKKGVKTTHIIDGRMPHSILLEIFTDEGIGTMVVR
ncbi:N-acetylglutamate kinase [Caldanaerobius fijiensis DSM 17918]|uniref:Acetylglutamate kinase n=1 Tax=Caldanaerobius fijiensis DSM 17918 TaxID=1121256 RepID=A0A1M5EWA2_9THEO|nr:acetylglutamate kinase [Caldanaerobius fijiensis]SHF83381.1 N-acetylglutamate kinase [Caldanaerobius fijiensis DSM 17918]